MTLASFMNTPGDALASLYMLILLGKATLLLIAAFGAALVLQRASAGARHLVWLVALVMLLVLPALATWSPIRLELLPSSLAGAAPALLESSLPGSARRESPIVRHGEPGRASIPKEIPGISTPVLPSDGSSDTQSAFPASFTIGGTILAVWAAVALLLGGWLAYGAFSVARIVRRSNVLDTPDWRAPLFEIADRLELTNAPRLLRSTDVKMPFACGVLHPTIVLPAECDDWNAERRSAVLLHELGHVRRRDLVGHTLGRIACALYWFHPLVWTAARKLRAESERACDDLALTCGARASDYAEHLLEIVTCVRNHATPSVALALAHRNEFEGRMLAILDPGQRRKAPSRLQAVSLVGMLGIFAFVVAAATPAARTANAEQPAAPVAQGNSDTDSEVSIDAASDPRVVAIVEPQARPAPAARPKEYSPLPRQAPSPRDAMINEKREIEHTSEHTSERTSERTSESGLRELLLTQDGQGKADDRADLLASILRTDTSATLRRVAAWGLRKYADEAPVAAMALTQALQRDASPAVREMAAWALSDADNDARVIDALVAALKDADLKVRTTAAWSLGHIGDSGARTVDALSEALASPDTRLRMAAAWAIGHAEPQRAPKALLAALGDQEPQVRRVVAWALYRIEDAEAFPAIDAALGVEKDPSVERALIHALASMGEKSVPAIKRLLESKDPAVRATAIKSLAGDGAGPWPWPWPEPRPNP